MTTKETEATVDSVDIAEDGPDVTVESTAPEATAEPLAEEAAASEPQTYRVRRSLCWAAGALVVVLAATAAALGWLVFAQHQRDAKEAEALDAARAYAITLTTTDQQTIDKNFTDIIGGATGEFKDAYSKAAAQMRKMLIDNKVTTVGTVIDGAAKGVHGDDVDVLLSVKQVVTSSVEPQPRTDFISMSITMRKVDNRWLAAKVLLAGSDGKGAK
jgi:Mce-associated membrane protein